ncbi:hypothetical protein IIZ72_01770 [Candidatus Saccharibacteria bacterium]|nr:hypothetical protein [Candidatus Saccharibacteria bacterium]
MDENLLKIRHERSKKDFPFLTLEDDEYVEFAFMRAKVCYMMIVGSVAAGLIVVLFLFLMILFGQSTLDAMGRNFIYIILFTLVVTALLAGAVATMVFKGNRLYVTNKHAIQLIMKSPVVKSVNIIDLASIEDASFHQNGFLQTMLHYGTFRLSTVGDETTYTFPFSDIAPSELKAVSKLISAAKEKKAAMKKD